MKKIYWILWIALTLIIAGYFSVKLLVSEDKSDFIVGDATHGHYQIELACSSCHTDPFGGKEVLQNACQNCHAEELNSVQDSHPKKKFTDPREALRIEGLDARYCASCHVEHQLEQTHEMGLTLPKDFCVHCHLDIGDERESHQGLEFDSCASAGCHNYHDNRALYENFLVANSGGDWLSDIGALKPRNHASLTAHQSITEIHSLDAKINTKISDSNVATHWANTSHGQADVECTHCHLDDDQQWLEQPSVTQCSACHDKESESFLASKHGMTLAQNLPAMTPAQSRLEFHDKAAHNTQGCNSCHKAHEFDSQYAATEACLNCHNDDHSQAFLASPHHVNSKNVIDEQVTCATCHLPTIAIEGSDNHYFVEHNQNNTLRPNEKMIRPVCMNCHSLEFSIDALADEELIRNNFNGKPTQHIPSIDWALKRASQ